MLRYAEQGITCGSLALALAAAAARRSGRGGAVYVSQVTSRPYHPLHAPYGATCDLPCKCVPCLNLGSACVASCAYREC